jgi:glutamyl-tRNA reductase
MSIVVLGLSHHTAPIELRERFAFAETRVPSVLEHLRSSKLADEAVIVSTCNRVEIYASINADPATACAALRKFLLECHDYRDPLHDELYVFTEPASLEHLFRVACGLDSLVLGETEILGQLKKAYDIALRQNHTGPRLNKAFQSAFNVAKHIRTETNIQRGNVSVASVSVELAEKIFNSLGQRNVLVIGAGDTGEKTARAFISRGAQNVLVCNRSADRAQTLAQALNGRAVPFDHWHAELPKLDIIITSTAAPGYIIDQARLKPLMQGRPQPLLLIDLGVPRNIAPETGALANTYLYNVDDLQAVADGYLKLRREEIARCEAIIKHKASILLAARQIPAAASAAKHAFGS